MVTKAIELSESQEYISNPIVVRHILILIQQVIQKWTPPKDQKVTASLSNQEQTHIREHVLTSIRELLIDFSKYVKKENNIISVYKK